MFDLIVFDLDGTLVDSRRDLANAANALLTESGAAPLDEVRIGRMVGDGAATLLARTFEARGLEAPPGALERFLRLYGERLLDHTRPYPEMPETLAALARRARLAVLTNKPLALTRRILDGLDLARHFPPAAVIGGDGPLPRKPDPAGLRYLADQAGASLASTLLVGDSMVDWTTARRAPTAICLARYGFGFERVPELSGSDSVIEAPSRLLGIVGNRYAG